LLCLKEHRRKIGNCDFQVEPLMCLSVATAQPTRVSLIHP
jgi:hypothetical protein